MLDIGRYIIQHTGPNRARRRAMKDTWIVGKIKPRNGKRKKKAKAKMAQASRKRNR
ncbi:MAG: hypothetical protein ABIG63_11405 [Chloroflexota bacterium]